MTVMVILFLFFALNGFFEQFFYQAGITAQQTSLMTLEKQDLVCKFEFIWDFLWSAQGQSIISG